jgi:ABC-2 type transport system permease protein
MTSKISCFDRAVFRRALKKTAPVWILYTLYELLLPLRLFSFCRGVSSCTDDFLVQIEKTILGYARINASLLPFLLGGLLAWVLFFWLFRAGTAYFYAALPVRRETLFLTNYLTGLLLCAAPALLSSLLLWAVGAGFGAAVFVPAMQVFTATMLGFLLFFSFAVLVCCVVGQMAAMPIVYVILNFTFFVLETIVRHLLFTFVYGMPYSQSSTMQSFALHATPVLGLLQGGFRVQTDWLERDGMYYMEYAPRLEGWSYLGMLAVLGLVFALCAFLLLKHREMERSGDVIAVGWLRPVALYVFTIGCALGLGALMAELFSSNTSDNFWYVLLFSCAGAFVGYFAGKMLLQKTVHVFRSGWLGLGACCLALLLAFGAAEFDLFGYSRYLPERSAVQAAGLTHYQSNGLYTTQDDAFIQDVLNLHTAAVSEKSKQEHRRHAYQLGTDYTEQFYITYRMTDGTLTERYYSIVYSEADLEDPDSLISRFSALYNSPGSVLIRTGFDTPRTEKNVLSCYVSSFDTGESLELTGRDAWRVYTACLDDINAGLLGAEDVSGSGSTKEAGNYTPLNLIFTVTTQVPGQTDSLYVDSIPLAAEETVRALTAFGAEPYWQAAG